MKKKTLALALALALCLGLTIPALAAEPTEYKNGVIHITNVLSYEEKDEWNITFTCVAPVKVMPGDVFDRTECTVEADAAKIPDDVELIEDYYRYPYEGGDGSATPEGEGVILTEPGRYMVEIWESNGDGGGFTRYVVTVLADGGDPSTGDTDPADRPSIEVEDIPATGMAYASTQTVTVDGKAVEFQMYALKDANGYGTNYIKLRDLAYVLNGTQAQFDVGYDGTVSLTTQQPYRVAGGEMSTPFSGDRTYSGGALSVKLDGSPLDMTAITLLDDNGGGYNYFKLRDLGKALGFNVGYSNEQGMFIETDQPYTDAN